MQGRPPILRDSLLIVLAYMAARACVYAALPVPNDDAWSHRDALMSLPRLAAFAALWLCNRHRWGNSIPFGWERAGKKGPAILISLLVVAAEAVHLFAFTPAHPWPLDLALLGIAATVPVVLFEEYAFRGGIHHGLIQRLGLGASILTGSLLFVFFHIEAQPLEGWPTLFLFAVALAALRARGLGLGWLALIHFVYDAIYFGQTRTAPFWSASNAVLHLLLLAAAVLAWPRKDYSTAPAPRPASRG